LTCYLSPLFGKQGLGEIFGESKANLKSPSPPLRKGDALSPSLEKRGKGRFSENLKLT